ncbi:unnamed protein product [Colias eurytheme]|nr:unnamed protein product [Colias eurytheme]
MLVGGDGYIIEASGPYAATSSDASIMKNILRNHNGPREEAVINYFLEAGDVFIVDRVFRDAVSMPPTKSRDQNQLTREEANKSKLITMCRWVVESINGRFKSDFKMFKYRVFNRSLHTTMSRLQNSRCTN